MSKVFIGVGHGGRDPGAVGHVREATANLVIALAMQEELNRYNISVRLSRSIDENDDLSEEIREANEFRPDLAIDIHNNAGGGNGFEVYAQTNSCKFRSHDLASKIERHVKDLGQESRGIKTRKNAAGSDYYGFLRQVKCPAVIVEGFFVDSADALDFVTAEKQKALGVAYAKGVLEYLGIPYRAAVFDVYKDIVQQRFGFDVNTMAYLSAYRYAEELMKRLAT